MLLTETMTETQKEHILPLEFVELGFLGATPHFSIHPLLDPPLSNFHMRPLTSLKLIILQRGLYYTEVQFQDVSTDWRKIIEIRVNQSCNITKEK